VAVGVEWAERSEPVDGHADIWPGFWSADAPSWANCALYPARRKTSRGAEPASGRDLRGNADRNAGRPATIAFLVSDAQGGRPFTPGK